MIPKALPGALAALLAIGAWSVPARAESARSGMVELKFGPYRPGIDNEFYGEGPYDRIFGSSSMLMSKVEFDYELWQKFGTVAIGGTIGFGQQSGNGFVKTTGARSTDTTVFHVIPLSLDAIYRFDWLQQKYHVPLVPNAKVGFDYYVYWITNASGQVVRTEDAAGNIAVGRGGVFGGHVSFGLQFQLDWLAPEMAHTFDTDIGVNHTYLFAEYVMSWINDFKAKHTLDLSSDTFMAGIAFEF
jgi:hypothetical protein